MNHFEVDPEVFERFPGMYLAIAVVDGLDNRSPRPSIDALWQQVWRDVSALAVDDARTHPNVNAWRRDFAAMSVSMKRFPTSIEAMLRRALKGSEVFSINPLVDFYNALSLKHVCPAGAFDLDALSAPVSLRFTTSKDRYQALDSDETVTVTAGEVAYASADVVLTRHFMWRQARAALIGSASERIFLISEIPGVAGAATAEAMRADMVRGLDEWFGRDCQSFVMQAGDHAIEWR